MKILKIRKINFKKEISIEEQETRIITTNKFLAMLSLFPSKFYFVKELKFKKKNYPFKMFNC